jgi:hypothetical protein
MKMEKVQAVINKYWLANVCAFAFTSKYYTNTHP